MWTGSQQIGVSLKPMLPVNLLRVSSGVLIFLSNVSISSCCIWCCCLICFLSEIFGQTDRGQNQKSTPRPTETSVATILASTKTAKTSLDWQDGMRHLRNGTIYFSVGVPDAICWHRTGRAGTLFTPSFLGCGCLPSVSFIRFHMSLICMQIICS